MLFDLCVLYWVNLKKCELALVIVGDKGLLLFNTVVAQSIDNAGRQKIILSLFVLYLIFFCFIAGQCKKFGFKRAERASRVRAQGNNKRVRP